MMNARSAVLPMLLTLCGPAPAPAPAADSRVEEEVATPKLEVVFVLDTTGSMSGLIKSAKERIWSIANLLATAKPTPEIRMGLVAYRDRGDQYVTKRAQLSDDLDAIYRELMSLVASGGGDTPESVNQALHEAVAATGWSDSNERSEVLRVVFLVGDAPPKMNYKDDVKFTETCKLAASKGVVINTIQCGSMSQTTQFWEQIAGLGKGRMFRVDQSGRATKNHARIVAPQDARLAEILALLKRHPSATTPFDAALLELGRKLSRVASRPMPQDARLVKIAREIAGLRNKTTPFDKQLAELAKQLDATRIWYGSRAEQTEQRKRDDDAERIQTHASLRVQASRARYNCSKAGERNWAGIGKELIHDLANGKVVLAKLPTDQLPKVLLEHSPKARAKFLTDKASERQRLQKRILELTEKRAKLIATWVSDLEAGRQQLASERKAAIEKHRAALQAEWTALDKKRKAAVAANKSRMSEIQHQLIAERGALTAARNLYIAKQTKRASGAQSWEGAIFEAIREQAESAGIAFARWGC